MRKRILTLGAVLAAVTGLAIGGTALAAGGNNTQPSQPKSQVAEPAGQELPAAQEQAGTAEPSQPGDTDSIQSENGKDDPAEAAGEQPGAENESGTEQPGVENESANEQPGNDGPGGHADEPANATADYQFEGVQ